MWPLLKNKPVILYSVNYNESTGTEFWCRQHTKRHTPFDDAEDKMRRQAGEWAIPNLSTAPLYKKHLILKNKSAYYMADFS